MKKHYTKRSILTEPISKIEKEDLNLSENIPNSETIKTMKETEEGIGLVKVKNSKKLFKALGI